MRARDALDLGRFRHHGFVERGTAGGVEQHDVITGKASRLERALSDLRRLLAFDDGKGFNTDLPAKHRKLFHGGRPPHVERRHENLAPALLGEALGDLGGGRRLARTLQPDHHDRDRRRRIEIDCGAV